MATDSLELKHRRLGAPASRRRKPAPLRHPRLGFAGLGWIGRQRMEALARSGLVEIVAVADTVSEAVRDAARAVPGAELVHSFDDLLAIEMDGLVIATPSAMHAEQAEQALERGLAVFCQKPLGRNEAETARVIETARRKNRLLGVDLSYRFITCLRELHGLCRGGELGEIYAADLMFHNAYGPDKPWFYDQKLSGGGCVIDLGIHLVDLAFWNLGFPEVTKVTSHLFSQGKPWHAASGQVEDYGVATLNLKTGATLRLACSWKLPAGCDAIITGSFFGTKGGAAFRNIDGSFYDFEAERFRGTTRQKLSCFLEQWGGRAALNWAEQLARGADFDPEIETLRQVAATLDAIYQDA
jgi:predicted dehydrogenase